MKRPELNHVGITVSDLDRSREFYCSSLGLETLVEVEADGEVVSTAVGVPDAAMRIAILAAGNSLLELIQYTKSQGLGSRPRTNDVGAMHPCFAVEDIDATYSELVAKGVEFVSPPTPSLDETGTRIAFLLDPDGVSVELVQPGKEDS